jgi:hypothetical protein
MLVAAGALLLAAPSAVAEPRAWTCAGAVEDPASWNPAGVPGATSDVTVDCPGGRLALASTAEVATAYVAGGSELAVNGGALGIAGPATLDGVLLVQAGTATFRGTTVVRQSPRVGLAGSSQPATLAFPGVTFLRGVWPGSPRQRTTFAWVRDGRAIRAAASARFRLRVTDAGHRIACRVAVVDRLYGGQGKATTAARLVRAPTPEV